MNERRRHPRHIVEGMGLYAKSIFSAEIEVLDISVSGCSVRSTKRLNMGVDYIFKFEHGEGIVSVKGNVVWEKLTAIKKLAAGESMPIYTIGIEFGDVAKDVDSIKKLIRDKVQDLKEQRLSGIRVRVDAAEKAVLSYLETCVVKDISLGGMQIETLQGPSVDTIFTMELILMRPDNSIQCKGRVAFCYEIPDSVPLRYRVGVEFVNPAAYEKSKLEEFIGALPLSP